MCGPPGLTWTSQQADIRRRVSDPGSTCVSFSPLLCSLSVSSLGGRWQLSSRQGQQSSAPALTCRLCRSRSALAIFLLAVRKIVLIACSRARLLMGACRPEVGSLPVLLMPHWWTRCLLNASLTLGFGTFAPALLLAGSLHVLICFCS